MAIHFIDYLEAFADAAPSEPALTFAYRNRPDVRFDYAGLDERINRAAHVLSELGVGRGDFVGCHLHDSPAHVDTMFGAWKLGAIPVNVNFRYVEDELTHLFRDAGMKVVVTEPELLEHANAAASHAPTLEHVVAAGADWEARLDAAADHRPEAPRSGDDRYMLYTGGTTGLPKGVLWRHEDILHAGFGAAAMPSVNMPEASSPESAVAVALEARAHLEAIKHHCPLPPLMHAAGQWALCRALLRGGRCTILGDLSFDPSFALEVLAREEVQLVWGAGDAHARPVIDAIRAEHGGSLSIPRLLVWVSGAVMITPSVKTDLEQALPGTVVMDGLGSSETGSQGQGRGYGDEGSPRFEMEPGTILIDDAMHPIPPEDARIGRVAKPGRIPIGYHDDPEKTAATFPVIDGVRYSVPGDMGRWESDGTVTLFGRGSVSINSGGEKVFPEEVEKALKSHPDVFDTLVVGTPDPLLQSRVTAVVQLRDGHDDPGLEALAAHCRGQLAGYKLPRALVVEERIVRSPSGKPDYRWALEAAKAGLGLD
jgi:acyl-CoA synthetase (AMP-forming)/AMP-acid ligase II